MSVCLASSMDGLMEIGAQLLAQTQKNLGRTAENVANMNTTGYKNQIRFNSLIGSVDEGSRVGSIATPAATNLQPGPLKQTGNPLDLALATSGMFHVQVEDQSLYTRNGAFEIAADGRVVTPQNYALQDANGGDIVLRRGPVEFLSDGTVLQNNLPVAKVAVVDVTEEELLPFGGGVYFSMRAASRPELLAEPIVQQGMLEGSNTVLADEMVGMMKAVREAETASRIIQTYDSLLGQAVTTFGRGNQ